MTPERQKWWDSLSAEEKQVRLAIKKFETDIKWRKKHFNGGLFYTSDQQKSYIAMGKHTIKALRKQIAMRPVMKRANGDDYRKCPHCGRYLWRIEDDIYYDYPPKYCEDCGQKLRWQ